MPAAPNFKSPLSVKGLPAIGIPSTTTTFNARTSVPILQSIAVFKIESQCFTVMILLLEAFILSSNFPNAMRAVEMLVICLLLLSHVSMLALPVMAIAVKTIMDRAAVIRNSTNVRPLLFIFRFLCVNKKIPSGKDEIGNQSVGSQAILDTARQGPSNFAPHPYGFRQKTWRIRHNAWRKFTFFNNTKLSRASITHKPCFAMNSTRKCKKSESFFLQRLRENFRAVYNC